MGERTFIPPHPNYSTRATFADILAWMEAVNEGSWSWLRNSPCKYVTIKLDTRAGAYRIEDRDGNEISFADLRRQFGQDDATPHSTGGR